MSGLDWFLVIGLNGVIIAYGLYLSRGVHTSTDWFLASRSLPWWLLGLSMYATAIDSSDLVADSGWAYHTGMRVLAVNWVGVLVGWGLAGFFIALPMYRAGMYTNAEYLEARFGVGVRVISALVQVQYRTLVLGLIATTSFWVMHIVCGWSFFHAWSAVAAIAVIASIYAALGGLRSVAVTDGLQFVVMTVAALVIWFVVWNQVGGWSGIEQKLTAHDPELAAQLMEAGQDYLGKTDVSEWSQRKIDGHVLLGSEYDAGKQELTRRTPIWMMSLGLILVGMAYSIVNHTQMMRMFAARSEWDLKMCVWVAGVVMVVMSFFNLTMGIMGRALMPDVSGLPRVKADAIYPYLVDQLAPVGLKGLVVAGIMAAAFSTYDSIGSALSALLTRDVYARLLVRRGSDRHYLRVGQWLTPLIIASAFLYVPSLLKEGMVMYYLDLTSAFVMPLLTLYLMGVFTRVHRRSGLIGLLVGTAYGVARLLAPTIAEHFGIAILPPFMIDTYAAYPISVLITGGTMVLVSLVRGWEQRGDLLHEETGGWLRESQLAVRRLEADSRADRPQRGAAAHLPAILAWLVVVIGGILFFVVIW